MKQVKKYRKQLSIFTISFLIVIVIAYLLHIQATGFQWVETGLTALMVFLTLRLFTIGTYYYKTIKQVEENNNKKVEDVTFNDIMNQKDTEDKEEIQKNEEELEKLVDQLSETSDPVKLATNLLSQLAKELNIVQGIVYKFDEEISKYKVISTYAYYGEETPKDFEIGEGLTGQTARDQKSMLIKELPDGYTKIISGLGSRIPSFVLISPLVHEEKTTAIVELAFFTELEDDKIKRFEGVLNKLAKYFA